MQRKLQDGYQTKDGIPIAGMIIRRFRSNRNEIFVITDTFFNFNFTSRDFSKFEFRGNTYNKPQLVNKVVRTYVEENPNCNYADLERIFPNYLQNRSGDVFKTMEEAQEVFDRTGHRRHYIKPEQLIQIADSTLATSNQWGIDNIVNFVDHVNKFEGNYKILNK